MQALKTKGKIFKSRDNSLKIILKTTFFPRRTGDDKQKCFRKVVVMIKNIKATLSEQDESYIESWIDFESCSLVLTKPKDSLKNKSITHECELRRLFGSAKDYKVVWKGEVVRSKKYKIGGVPIETKTKQKK